MEKAITSSMLLKAWIVNYLVLSSTMIYGLHLLLEEQQNEDRHYLFREGLQASAMALLLCVSPPLLLTPIMTAITIRDINQGKIGRAKNQDTSLSSVDH